MSGFEIPENARREPTPMELWLGREFHGLRLDDPERFVGVRFDGEPAEVFLARVAPFWAGRLH